MNEKESNESKSNHPADNLASKKKELLTESNTSEQREHIVSEDSLELRDMSRKERRRYQQAQEREKLGELTFWRKVQYILTYYTWKFLGVVGACALILFIIQRIYIATRPIALSALLVNDPENTVFTENMIDLYKEYYEVRDDARFLIDTNFIIVPAEPDSVPDNQQLSYYTKMMSNLINDSAHIIICDADVIDYYAVDGYIAELKHALPPDLYEAFKGRYYEFDGPVEDSDYYAIDISGMEFTRRTGIGLEHPYICIPTVVSEEHRETSFQVLRIILDLEQGSLTQ